MSRLDTRIGNLDVTAVNCGVSGVEEDDLRCSGRKRDGRVSDYGETFNGPNRIGDIVGRRAD